VDKWVAKMNQNILTIENKHDRHLAKVEAREKEISFKVMFDITF
jgi:hypothetical protein